MESNKQNLYPNIQQLSYPPTYVNNNPTNLNNANSSNPSYAQYVPPQDGWCERNHRNKPQSNSVGIASLIFLSGGMNMAYSFGFIQYNSFVVTNHLLISWFIGAIIGAVIGAVVVNYLQKKLIVLFSAMLVVIGGILFISLPHDFDATVAARYLDGIGNGLVFVTSLVMAGEESVINMRGFLASSVEAMSFSLGMYLQIIFASVWTAEINQDFAISQVNGCLAILYGALAFLMGFCLIIESPVFLLLRQQEQPAIDALRRLQRPYVVTQETYSLLEEHKRYIAENREMSLSEAFISGLPALLKLCLYRSIVALTFTSMVFVAFFISTNKSTNYAKWPYIVLGTCRWLGVFISAIMMDGVGRKKPMLFGMLICGGMAIGVAIIFGDIWNLFNIDKMTVALYLLFIYQFFAGISISASSAYLTEAFPLAVKPYYIAFAFVWEMLVQIVVTVCDKSLYSVSDYFYAVGALSIVFFVFAVLCLPETKMTTMREAQRKFSKFITMD